MILLHNIIEITHLPDDDRCAMLIIIIPGSRRIGLDPVEGARLGRAIAANGLGQKALGSRLISGLVRRKSMVWPALSAAQ